MISCVKRAVALPERIDGHSQATDNLVKVVLWADARAVLKERQAIMQHEIGWACEAEASRRAASRICYLLPCVSSYVTGISIYTGQADSDSGHKHSLTRCHAQALGPPKRSHEGTGLPNIPASWMLAPLCPGLTWQQAPAGHATHRR